MVDDRGRYAGFHERYQDYEANPYNYLRAATR